MHVQVPVLLVVLISIGLASATRCSKGIPFGGSCYTFVSNGHRSWFKAWQYCASNGGHLAQITNSVENEFLKSLARASGFKWIWIDGNDTDQQKTWKLGFHRVMTFFDFGAANENTGDTNANCLMLDKNHNYRWSDHPCQQRLPFICEYPGHGTPNCLNPL